MSPTNIRNTPGHSTLIMAALAMLTVLTTWPQPALADRLGIKCGDNGAFYCHDTDPSSFTRCIEHELYLFNCPDGLHFNTLSQTCDWPDNADCGGRGGRGGGGKNHNHNRNHNLVMADAGDESWDSDKHGTFVASSFFFFSFFCCCCNYSNCQKKR